MKGFNYEQYDATGLAELIRKKEVTETEVLKQAVIRIEAMNGTLNAVVNKFYSKAFSKSDPGKGEDHHFKGVPLLLKDITQEVKGEKLTSGSKAYRHYRSETDSEFVSRLKKAGLRPLGHTNVPEFALMGITEPAHYGPARNPWNICHTPGGSSGGAAAAVAAGMVPAAGANDGGGSIRIPAAYCGLFGLKPARGRVPVGPSQGRLWQGASTEHVLTRSVRDSAAILDEVCGEEKSGAFRAPFYSGKYRDEVTKPVGKNIKIAFSVQSPIGTEVHKECVESVLKTARYLEKEGFEVEEAEAPVDGRKIAGSYLMLYFGEVAATFRHLEKVLGKKVKMGDVEPATWLLGLMGKAVTAEEYVMGLREWDIAARHMEAFHETYDFYMTPVTAMPPAKIGELALKKREEMLIRIISAAGAGKAVKKAGLIDQLAEQNLMRTPFTQLANLTGQPAMSVPLHMTGEGLPAGVQFMAARGREDMLFRLAGMLEKSELWIDYRQNPFYKLSPVK